MNENAERINGWAAMLGVIAAMGSYALTGQIIPGVWWMDTQNLLSMFLGYFIAGVILLSIKKPDDHDDDPGGGMMIPTYNQV